MRASGRSRLGLAPVLCGVVLLTALAFCFADLRLLSPDPRAMVSAMGAGLAAPDFSIWAALLEAAALTLAFAFCGVFLGAGVGLLLAPFYGVALVRHLCIAVRAIHELFWALLLMQVTGLTPTTGILAIALPYAGIFAKVFAEYLDDVPPEAADALPRGVSGVSVLLVARLPQAAREMRAYTLYRLECGLRSSAVLGFIGLPTLGFLLETYFRQAHYDQAVAVLAVYLALILPIRIWMRWPLAPLYLAASVWLLARFDAPPMGEGVLARFLSEDIVPAPLRDGGWLSFGGWSDLANWFATLFGQQILPGIWTTLILSQLALALAAIVAFIGCPLIIPRVTGRVGALIGHTLLVISRSIPDYMLAFILLQVLGPSMLPAILALGLHNGAIIAHLLGRQGVAISEGLRADAPRGLVLWGYELLPRQTSNFLALCLYRWEIIVRDSAIFGLIGVATLGFYVDANLQQLRIDRAVMLLLAMGGLTLAIDSVANWLRRRMRLARGPVADVGEAAVRRSGAPPS